VTTIEKEHRCQQISNVHCILSTHTIISRDKAKNAFKDVILETAEHVQSMWLSERIQRIFNSFFFSINLIVNCRTLLTGSQQQQHVAFTTEKFEYFELFTKVNYFLTLRGFRLYKHNLRAATYSLTLKSPN